MPGVLIGPFYPAGTRYRRARLLDGSTQEPLGYSVPCLAVVEAWMLQVLEELHLPPSPRAVEDAWVLFDTDPSGPYAVALGLCAFRKGGDDSRLPAGEVVVIKRSSRGP